MGLSSDVGRSVKLEIQELFASLGKATWTIRSYFSILWWSIREPFRRFFKESATIVLLIASFHFFAEVVATFFNQPILSIHLPTSIKVTIVVLAIWMIHHRLNEFKHDDQSSVFAENIARIFGEIAALDFAGTENIRQQRLRDFIEKTLLAFMHIFRKKCTVRLSIMLLSDNKKLKPIYFIPDSSVFDLTLELAPGEGAAGKAYGSGHIIYIPAIKYRQGIAVKRGDEYSFSLENLAYLPIEKANFKSLICFPIATSTGISGVLNVDSNKQNIFGVSDFNYGYVAASVIGMALDKYRNS